MRQQIYQAAWSLFKSIIAPRVSMNDWSKDPEATAEKLAKGVWNQIQFAEYFGGTSVIFTGDSNAEFGNSFDQMIAWTGCGIVINTGKAGSRFDHHVLIYKSSTGQKILAYIKEHKIPVFLNLSGNSVLQKAMDILEPSIIEFKTLFSPEQEFINTDLPDIMVPILAPLMGMTEDQLKVDVNTCNAIVKKHFPYFVEIGDIFRTMDDQSKDSGLIFEQAAGVLSDGLVHYSPAWNIKYRFPYYSNIAKQVFGL
jgi:hypothetical protein